MVDDRKLAMAKLSLAAAILEDAEDPGVLLQWARHEALTLDLITHDSEADSSLISDREDLLQMLQDAVESGNDLRAYAADTMFEAVHENLTEALKRNEPLLRTTKGGLLEFYMDDMPGAWLSLATELQTLDSVVADSWSGLFKKLAFEYLDEGMVNSAVMLRFASLDWSALSVIEREDGGRSLHFSGQDTPETYEAMEEILLRLRNSKGDQQLARLCAARALYWISSFTCKEQVQARVGTGGKLDEIISWILEDLDPAHRADFGHRIFNSIAWAIVKTPGRPESYYERALELAKRALQLAPDSVNVVNTLGVAQFRVDEFDNAIRTLASSHLIRRLSRDEFSPTPLEEIPVLKPVFLKLLDPSVKPLVFLGNSEEPKIITAMLSGSPSPVISEPSDALVIAMALWQKNQFAAARETLATQQLPLRITDDEEFDKEARAMIQ